MLTPTLAVIKGRTLSTGQGWGAADVIQMSALPRDGENRGTESAVPGSRQTSVHRSGQEGAQGRSTQQHPLPCPQHLHLFSQAQDHSPASSQHSAALRGQGIASQPVAATGAHTLSSTAAPSQLQGLGRPASTTLPSPQGACGVRALGQEGSGAQGAPKASAGLCLCPAPVPLPGSTSAATRLRLSCSTPLVPNSANSPLSLQPAVRQRAGRERGPCSGTISPLQPPP